MPLNLNVFFLPRASNRLLLARLGGTEPAKRRPQSLAAPKDRLEQIAVLRDPVEGLAAAEIARSHSLRQLLPAQRRRDRRARLRTHRVNRGDRLAVSVLAVIDEHAAPLLLQPLCRHE